jgi:hypothetical protein
MPGGDVVVGTKIVIHYFNWTKKSTKIHSKDIIYVKVGSIQTRIKQYWLIGSLNNVQCLQRIRTLEVLYFNSSLSDNRWKVFFCDWATCQTKFFSFHTQQFSAISLLLFNSL